MMNLKEQARLYFDVQDLGYDYDGNSDCGSVGRSSYPRTVRDYCRDWLDSYDGVRACLYLDGRPHWLGLADLEDDWEAPYWPSIECGYESPAWYGKRQRKWYRWNEKFDVAWFHLGSYMDPTSMYPSAEKFMKRFMMWGDDIEGKAQWVR